MTKITILGGTGYTGANIVKEAAKRGHHVTSFSRNVPSDQVEGVQYETASLTNDTVRQAAVDSADVIIAALAPRGELESQLAGIYARIAELASTSNTRLGIVGGFSALRPAEGAPRFAEGDGIPEQYAAEAKVMHAVLLALENSAPNGLDWFYISPAQNYGAHVPGEATGEYRLGGQVALFDKDGTSAISGADFAKAIIDEVETPAHHSQQISVAY
jgi:putative NADH-flavin reductase